MSPAPDCESQIHMYIAVKSTSKFFFEMLSCKRQLLSLVLSSSTDAYYEVLTLKISSERHERGAEETPQLAQCVRVTEHTKVVIKS